MEGRVHGGNPHAVETARAVRAAPLEAGVQVSRPISELAG